MIQIETKRKRIPAEGLILLALIFFVLTGCKSNQGPDEFLANIIAENQSGATVDVYVDGEFKFTLVNGEANKVSNITQGVHAIEARLTENGLAFFSSEIATNFSGDYVWTIEGAAVLRVTNNYGETITIAVNNNILGDLENNASETLSKVPFGQHTLAAYKKSDGEIITSLVLDVTEIKEYVWIVTNSP